MRSANQDQTAGSILLGEYLGISSARVLRKLSVVKSFPANRMIANCLESRLSAARLESAGMSLRLVRSPVAPKMTMTQGEATGFAFERFMRVPCNEFNAPRLRSIPGSGLLFRVTAELKTHGRQQLGGEFAFTSRRETFIERFGKHGSGGAGLDAGDNRPAAFTGIRHSARKTLEGRLLEKRDSGQVEQPGGNDAAAAPDFRDVGEIEVVLVVFGIAQRRGFRVGFVMLLADVGVLEDVEAFGVGGHQAIFDSVVNHFDEMASA